MKGTRRDRRRYRQSSLRILMRVRVALSTSHRGNSLKLRLADLVAFFQVCPRVMTLTFWPIMKSWTAWWTQFFTIEVFAPSTFSWLSRVAWPSVAEMKASLLKKARSSTSATSASPTETTYQTTLARSSATQNCWESPGKTTKKQNCEINWRKIELFSNYKKNETILQPLVHQIDCYSWNNILNI